MPLAQRHHRSRDAVHGRGFSLLELLTVIVVSAILAGLAANVLSQPLAGHVALSQRAGLVHAAENALRRMQRDIRRAVPNSIRVDTDGQAIELVRTLDGARYERNVDADQVLTIVGGLAYLRARSMLPYDSERAYLVLVSSGADQDVSASRVPFLIPSGTTIHVGAGGDALAWTPPPGSADLRFDDAAPAGRVYLVDTPVAYVCHDGELKRYTQYAPAAIQPVPPPTVGALVADGVAACTFRHQPQRPGRREQVTVVLTLQDAQAQERISLLHNIRVDNAP